MSFLMLMKSPQTKFSVHTMRELEIDRYIGRYLGFTDISIYRYRPKRPILSASVGVDKTLLYSSRIQTTCARKHNEASRDSYLTTTLAGAVS